MNGVVHAIERKAAAVEHHAARGLEPLRADGALRVGRRFPTAEAAAARHSFVLPRHCVLTAAAGNDGEAAAGDFHIAAGIKPVARRCNGDAAAADVYRAARRVLIVFSAQAVLARGNRQCAVRDVNAVFARQAVACRRDGNAAARDFQLALGHDAVPAGGGNGQRARAVDCQRFLGEDGGINVVFVDGLEAFAAGKRIFRFCVQRQEHLVRLTDIDGGGGFAVNACAAEYKLHLRVLGRVHDDLPAAQRAGQQVHALFRDGGRRAVYGHAVGVRKNLIAA